MKKMTGSQRDIINPLDSIISNTIRMVKMSAQQDIANAIIDKSDSGEIGDEIIWRTEDTTQKPGHFPFYVWRNGKKTWYATADKSIYNVLTMSNPAAVDFGWIDPLLVIPARILRGGVSHSARFIMWNPERDTLSAAVYGKHFIPVVDTINGIIHAAKKDKIWQDYMHAGGGTGRININDEILDGIKQEIQGDKTKNPLEAIYHFLGRINDVTETGTRLGQYMKAINLGLSPETADRLATEVTLNFNKLGSTARKVNKYIPFFGANVQDLHKFYSAHFKNGGVKGFGQTVAKGLAYITLPSLLLWAYNNMDDKRREAYQKLEQWKKNNFWYFITPDGKHAIPYPKPFLLGMVYGSVPERMLDYFALKDRRALEGGLSSLVAGLTPGYTPLAIQTLIELAMNRSLFYDRDIVPKSEQVLEPMYQYGPYTSEIAKLAGKTNLSALSPRRVDYLINAMGGNLAREVSTVIDDVMRSDTVTKITGGTTRAKKDWYEYLPVVDNIVVSTRLFKGPLYEWNDNYPKLQKALKTAEKSAEMGAPLSNSQMVILNSAESIKNILKLNTAKDGIWKLQSQEKKIQMANGMTSQEKRDAIDALDAQILVLSQVGLNALDEYNDAVDDVTKEMDARK
jgi:hypothetical protein